MDLIARRASNASITVACAESLTSGAIASALGRGEDASTWFRGGVVAYAPAVKFEVLGVAKGPVVTSSCALQMCRGARRVLVADAAVAVTGVGGPGGEEGRPPGGGAAAGHRLHRDLVERTLGGDVAQVRG
ncbi:nicotinamide-nucleotide amidohydrolase family protein [Nocardioides pelophilus]|uniref:nicotinamide-nucleotide amidohydrolase family protein n=1 Tax=Nocardioides pelophilus TaxID=2172019 RepID=UPI001C7E70C2|nr:nicotinamide-nucleotide amidohydrolase family protein [Nocardioides pelophilus]